MKEKPYGQHFSMVVSVVLSLFIVQLSFGKDAQPDRWRIAMSLSQSAIASIEAGDQEQAKQSLQALMKIYSDDPAADWMVSISAYLRDAHFDKVELTYQSPIDGEFNQATPMALQACLFKLYAWGGQDEQAMAAASDIATGYRYQKDFPKLLILMVEEYYYRALQERQRDQQQTAKTCFQNSAMLIERHLLGISENDPNMKSSAAESIVSDKLFESEVWYTLGVIYFQMEEWLLSADAFFKSLQLNPNHQFSGGMHGLIAGCYRRFKGDNKLPPEVADLVIEWGFKTLFENYPNDRDVKYAAMSLGELYLMQGKPLQACEYLNWFLDHAKSNDGRIPRVQKLMDEGGCMR